MNYDHYDESARNVRELGIFCAKYGITKVDLQNLAHEKLMQERKHYEGIHQYEHYRRSRHKKKIA